MVQLEVRYKQAIKNYVNGHEFLSVEEVITPASLYVRLDIQAFIYDADLGWSRQWTFSFYSESIEIKPYNEFDFVVLVFVVTLNG